MDRVSFLFYNLELEAVKRVSLDLEVLREKFLALVKTANENYMVGASVIDENLSDTILIAKIRSTSSLTKIRFGCSFSAAYHIKKHAATGMQAGYLTEANEAIQDSRSPIVHLNQEGDARVVSFSSVKKGRSLVLEEKGSILLMSYMRNY